MYKSPDKFFTVTFGRNIEYNITNSSGIGSILLDKVKQAKIKEEELLWWGTEI